ncbi:DUF2808 domain-containing protein [Synechococcus sp. ATX 2A4]|nr:DUF2808 domain-containing protein [Synechococcus sp. ATX 2A4]
MVALALVLAPSLPVADLEPPAAALEIRGSTYFRKGPFQLNMITYSSNVSQPWPEYYVTIPMPEQAGANLGALEIQQIGGADWQFGFDASRTRAFIGKPRREGRQVPVEASFDQQRRQFLIRFPQPPVPGETVTVALRPIRNPIQADTYLFTVRAFPDGPQPVATPVGVGRVRIYDLYWD